MATEREAAQARREELGAFLRARRDALRPGDVGLVDHGPRRVEGLRREEVADLAAVSLTWYTWLEQGRVERTTPEVLDALARALLLDDVGRRHLFRLAGAPVPEPRAGGPPDDGLVAWIRELGVPACATDLRTDFIAWNDAYARLLGDPAELPPDRRNAMVVMLTDERFRRVAGWDAIAASRVAMFRALAAERADDPRLGEVRDLLVAESPLFRELWDRNEVRPFEPGVFVVHDPEVGEIRTREVVLRPYDRPDLLVAVLNPLDDASRRRLQQLLARPG